MGSLVSYEMDSGVARITLDDGKVNLLSPTMLGEIGAALDQAEQDGAVVVLGGRDGVFSAGFDLAVLRGGGTDGTAMLRGGFELSYRLLSFPTPVVIACTGHAIAMGLFVVLSGDYRIGVAGAAHKLVANEVAIGLPLPRSAIEVCRQRLAPAHFGRVTLLAETYAPDAAVAGGLLDLTVPADELAATVDRTAAGFAELNQPAHAASKLLAREPHLQALRAAIEADGDYGLGG